MAIFQGIKYEGDNSIPGKAERVCKGCGAKLPENAKFCFDCGARIPDEETVTCPSCREPTPKGKFCLHCGCRLAVICPKCGASLTPRVRFCPKCGERLGN